VRAFLPALFLAGATPAWAAEPLDGTYLTIGPVGAAARVGAAWVSAVGLELSVVNVSERRLPVALGGTVGGVSYAGRAGGRFWIEGELALGGPLPLGLGVGPAVEVDRVRPFRPGGQATIWIFVGIVPYARVGALRDTGLFFEAGAMLKIPARRFP
jgi:hypothetical protein